MSCGFIRFFWIPICILSVIGSYSTLHAGAKTPKSFRVQPIDPPKTVVDFLAMIIKAGPADLLPTNGSLCGAYLVDGGPEYRVNPSGKEALALKKSLHDGANAAIVPTYYVLETLGLGGLPLEGVPSIQTEKGSDYLVSTSKYNLAQQRLNQSPLQIAVESETPRVLVVGKRRGQDLARFFRKIGADAWNVDISGAGPQDADLISDALGYEGNATRESRGFDLITAPELWQDLHFTQRTHFLQAAFARLKPGGTLRISVWAPGLENLGGSVQNLAAQAQNTELWNSVKSQVENALAGLAYSVSLRLRELSMPVSTDSLLDPAFNLFQPEFRPLAGDAIQTAGPDGWRQIEAGSKKALSLLIMVRKPTGGTLEWFWNEG